MPDIANPEVAPGEGLAISAWAAVRPRCQSSLAGFLFAHAVVLPDGTSSVATLVLGCKCIGGHAFSRRNFARLASPYP
jgi:hypothetical protein